MQLTVQQILAASAALKALDTYERVVREGSNERVVREPYRFGGAVRMALARIQAGLRVHADAFDAAHDALVREISGGEAQIRPEMHGQQARFREEIGKVLAATHALDLPALTEADLRLDDNPLPPSVLVALLPLLSA